MLCSNTGEGRGGGADGDSGGDVGEGQIKVDFYSSGTLPERQWMAEPLISVNKMLL